MGTKACAAESRHGRKVESEGDYGDYGEFSSTVSSVGTIDETFAYIISITRPAVLWNGPECTYNEETDTYKGIDCVFGYISERKYIDLKFSDIGNVKGAYPEFEN